VIVRGDSLDDVQGVFGAVEVELQKRHSGASAWICGGIRKCIRISGGWSNLLTRDSKIVSRPALVGNHKVAAFCNWL
jgi:hypothetical protein